MLSSTIRSIAKLDLFERLQQTFPDQPPNQNKLAGIVQIAWKVARSESWRLERVAQGGTGMQRQRHLVAVKTQGKRFSALIEPVRKERPRTDDGVEPDLTEMR